MLSAIHAGKKQMGIDDDIFMALKENTVGGERLSSLDADALGKILDAMRGAGFRVAMTETPETARLRAMVVSLWHGMHDAGIVGNKNGYDAYCKRICKRPLVSLTVKQCQGVIETLKRWWARETGNPQAAVCHGVLAGSAHPSTINGRPVTGECDEIQ